MLVIANVLRSPLLNRGRWLLANSIYLMARFRVLIGMAQLRLQKVKQSSFLCFCHYVKKIDLHVDSLKVVSFIHCFFRRCFLKVDLTLIWHANSNGVLMWYIKRGWIFSMSFAVKHITFTHLFTNICWLVCFYKHRWSSYLLVVIWVTW